MKEPKNWLGHQADHTVKYTKDSGLPSVISGRVEPAVSLWNSAIGTLGQGLNICTGSGCSDSHIVTVKTASNDVDSISENISNDADKGCGTSTACVKPGSGDSESDGPGRHMGNMAMVFELPPWSATQDDTTKVWTRSQWEWTDNSALIGSQTFPKSGIYYLYAGPYMLHEFGHTLGLPDFYSDMESGLVALRSAAMHGNPKTVTTQDIAQLLAIYFGHTTDPH